MNINRELIEKYHRDECTPEEAAAVEEWLFSEENDEPLDLPAGEDKHLHKQQMWDAIQTSMPGDNVVPIKPRGFNASFWRGAIAATVTLAFVAFAFLKLRDGKDGQVLEPVLVNNTSGMQIKHIQADDYSMSVGPNTSARINDGNGTILFTGSIVIKPKKDIEFSFGAGQKKVTFKTGQTYIILNNADGSGKVIVVNEKNLMDIPPLLQKKITTQFNI